MEWNKINEYLRKNASKKTRDELLATTGLTLDGFYSRMRRMGLDWKYKDRRPEFGGTPGSLAEATGRKTSETAATHTRKLLNEAIEKIGQLEAEKLHLSKIVQTPQTFEITEKVPKGKSEATAFLIASDWHVEEPVRLEDVGGLNQYSSEIAKSRATKFFQNGLRLIQIFQKDTTITNVVLALLGDFFSNSIHDDLKEINEMLPGDAAWYARNLILSGIDFILNNSSVHLTVVCHSGNHGRMTQRLRIAAEGGNSLEKFMYRTMAERYLGNKRITFIIAEGQHTILPVYDMKIRFLHGHSIKYGGGIGGITIPIRKALAQWNKAQRVDLTCLGHFHQFLDGGDFIVNSSLIGYNAFAQFIKADYERPTQTFFLITNKYGGAKSVVAPIWVE